CGQGRNVPWTF
nr:immunoglobulin light chain junction region [Macaca mulatta]